MDDLNIFLGNEDLLQADQYINEDLSLRLRDAITMSKGYINDPNLQDCMTHIGVLTANSIPTNSKANSTRIQFLINRLERALSNGFTNKLTEPIFYEVDITNIVRLAESISGSIENSSFEGNDHLFWDDSASESPVLFDSSSDMAQMLVREQFGEDALWQIRNENFEKWKRSFAAGCHLLDRHIPEAAHIVRQCLGTIIPVTSNKPGMSISSTPSNLTGIFLASLVPGRYMAEALVHEVGHDVLNRLHRHTPLYKTTTRVYYSPFRNDARPASGLLHAAYSFYNVIVYLAQISKLEERLKTWALQRATSYIFDVLLCSSLFLQIENMPPRGYHLASNIENNTKKLADLLSIKFDEELCTKKVTHFEAWASSIENDDYPGIQETFYNLLDEFKALKSRQSREIKYESPLEIDAATFRNTYTHCFGPLVFPWQGLINKNNLAKELNRLLEKQLCFMDMDQHFGHGNTPSCHAFLDDVISGQREEEQLKNWFLAILDFSDLISATVWGDRSFFKNYFVDGDISWLFWNRAGLTVGLHADTANNLHCLVRGSKTFYVAPPTDTFPLTKSDAECGAGFSDFKPFESQKLAREVGWFITLKAGQALYLPNNWWHAVHYKEDSVAISAIDAEII